MGIVWSATELTASLAGSLVGLYTVLCGLHSLCSGSALLAIQRSAVPEIQASILQLSGAYLRRGQAALQSPQKAASVLLLSPIGLLLWMLSLQCFLAARVVATPHTSQVALPVLAGSVAVLLAAPRLWWNLMLVLGVAAPALLAWAPLAEPEAPEEAADAEGDVSREAETDEVGESGAAEAEEK
ncbi:unnamed protein product [Effrenium voratum]|uniref:Uncharacterized protein n=1 Tax=Effrenium voratum TaxID=2562239 RepID=A0AA36MKZ4_9DINO|nr:unnamed protein product [Effrenium voratum]CAJ1423373.1 unnamed protein product [Effrenium voratum]